MPRPRFTEDIEFRTDVGTGGNVIRRGRFVRRRRTINGRNVPGNARYYRRRQLELLAGRGAAQNVSAGRQRAANVARRAGRNAGNARKVARRPSRSRGGIRGALARVARGVANRLERRRRSR